VELEWRPEIADDLKALPTEELKRAAVQLMADVAKGKEVGRELDYRVATGDLRDCYKVYFGVPGAHAKPAYRFVYRLLPDRVEAVTVEAIAIGPRSASEVYMTVAERLGRRPS
jgi:hypothetical protein